MGAVVEKQWQVVTPAALCPERDRCLAGLLWCVCVQVCVLVLCVCERCQSSLVPEKETSWLI